MSSPVHCLASEIAGLLQDHQARLKTPKAIQLTQNPTPVSYPNTSVQHYNNAPRSQEKMASALDFDPGNSSYWSERDRDIVFGANYNAFIATKYTGFSICHPVYDDTKMIKCVQHFLQSAMCSELPTATFLFLPNWENKSINAYRALVRDNPEYCTTLGFIPKTNSHMQCQPRGRVYNVISPTTPGAWILLLSGTKKHSSV